MDWIKFHSKNTRAIWPQKGTKTHKNQAGPACLLSICVYPRNPWPKTPGIESTSYKPFCRKRSAKGAKKPRFRRDFLRILSFFAARNDRARPHLFAPVFLTRSSSPVRYPNCTRWRACDQHRKSQKDGGRKMANQFTPQRRSKNAEDT